MSYTPTTWQTGDTITAEKLNHMEDGIGDAVSSSLPEVYPADDGKFLMVVNGEWHVVDTTFVVNCTPTSPDLSGTMDKTPAEIYAAYQAGLEIIVRLIRGSGEYIEIRPIVSVDNESGTASLVGSAVDGAEETGYFLVQFYTSTSESTYSTHLFPLTPYSP